MRPYCFFGLMGNLIPTSIMSLLAGCIITDRQLEINTLADRLVSEYCDDCVLVKITEARYAKNTINNQQEVLLVVEGVVEDVISESTMKKLPVGTAVRNVELVDDEDLARQLLDKMKESNTIPIELDYTYAFFNEVSPPDGRSNIPVEGCSYPLMACWIGCEFYDPDIPIDEQTIISAYRRKVVKQENDWISFIDEVAEYRNDNTNRVYYAGSSNDVAFLYHQTSKGIREWQIRNIDLLNDVRRPFSCDKKRWVAIKDDKDEKFSCWDIRAATRDFIGRLPSESALVKATDEFFTTDRGRPYKDGTPVLICKREYKVIASYSAKLHKGDIVCTSWLVDDYTSTTNILSNKKEHQRHPLADGRTLYVTWDAEMLRKGNTGGYFYIGDVFAAPMELVWDSDVKHEALIPFDEKTVIEAYIEKAESRMGNIRKDGNTISDKEREGRRCTNR